MPPAPNRKWPSKKESCSEKKITEQEARDFLESIEKDKRESFMKEYKSLCVKYGYEISVAMIDLVVRPLNQS
jgi:hypothetical protein